MGTRHRGPSVGLRLADWGVAAVLVALAVLLAVANVLADDPTTRVDSHSWWQLPVLVGTAVPVLWWRRGVLPVVGVSTAMMAVHLLAFGAVVRCGSGLPLAFTLAFLTGVTTLRHRSWSPWAPLALVAVLDALVLVRDTAAGVDLLPVALVVSGALFGIGRAVAHRAELGQVLRERNEQLRALRDERAALDVSDDRARLSARLELLLDERLGQLAAAAERGAASAADTVTLLATLEEDSRRTLDDMRQVVGLLRGGEVSLAPAPSVAHLDALLARHLGPGSRLQVSGDPRVLPASVELSAYRIVEHLVVAMEGERDVAVGMRFDVDALEIRVEGPVARAVELRGAVGRARERARLHAGSLEVRTGRGQARVVARLPVLESV